MNTRRVLSIVAVLLTIAVLLAPVASAGGPRAAAPTLSPAMEKIAPTLRPLAVQGGAELVHVLVTVREGADVDPYMEVSLRRPFVVNGEETVFGFVRASNLAKVAGVGGVVSVQPVVLERNGPVVPPNEWVQEPDLQALRDRVEALKAMDLPYTVSPEVERGNWATAWADVGLTHKSSTAWRKGYTGEGVLVGVADDGVDFAHPDLMGTWATVTDPASPHYGWPMMFSPISMYLYVLDNAMGTHYLASNSITWYCDTSTTPTTTETVSDTIQMAYTPVGDPNPGVEHVYTAPPTSVSGVYHMGSFPDDNLSSLYGEAVAVVVVDENQSGVYDTVYVDLDNDYDFTDEKPMTKASPVGYRDMDGDGLADISGGLIYFIADGVTPIPVSDWLWGPSYAPVPSNGDLVCFHGALDSGYAHGTQCASNVVGQGALTAMAPVFRDLPGDGKPNAVVIGSAPGAKVVGISDLYYNFDSSKTDAFLFSTIGYDGVPGSGDELQIVSNSYGSSDQDNDGWELDGRDVSFLVGNYSPSTSFLFSTGNGGPGYGTTAPPSPEVGIAIGASTQFGSTGWDSITDTVQIVRNDVAPFSNRGPGARGGVGVDVVADGAYSSGAEGINYSGYDGATAWSTWGGTSRSAPVATGNLALVYQAYKEEHGTWPTVDVARAILMSGADHINYDVLAQGAGTVNADRSTDVAAGNYGLYAQPSKWRVGDYRGMEYPAFANLIGPGEADTRLFTLVNDSNVEITVSLSDGRMRRIDSRSFDWASQPITEESEYNSLVVPDYLIPIDPDTIPAETDLMIVRANYPLEQLDLEGDYESDSRWRLLVYNWTDIDGDGKLWDDANGNGVVNHVNSEEVKNIDGSMDLDWENSEIDQYEYVRFAYHRPGATTLQVSVRDPLERMADGLFIGLQHQTRTEQQPTTDMVFQIDFYEYADWDWLTLSDSEVTIPANGYATFTATISVPADVPYGGYEGAIFVEDPGTEAPFVSRLPLLMNETGGRVASWTPPQEIIPGAGGFDGHLSVIPVYLSVAPAWDGTGALQFAGLEADDSDALYNNGALRGLDDWTWREETGDWRFFFLDMTGAPAPGTKLVVQSVWDDDAPPTDVDTIILGPTLDDYTDPQSPACNPGYFGPYTLDVVGKSPAVQAGRGTWRFDTATDGAEEWVTAPLQSGLHEILLHNVLYSGAKFRVPYTVTVGTVQVQPAELSLSTASDEGSAMITFTSGITLSDLVAEGYGLSAPVVHKGMTVTQSSTQVPGDNPLDETDGWRLFPFAVEHCASASISTGNATTNDVDLYVLFDENEDGVFSYPSESVGSSGSPTSDEVVSLYAPDDGDYLAAVFGYDVQGGGTYDLAIQTIQGFDLAVTGIPAGIVVPQVPIVLTVNYSKTMESGQTYLGAVHLGPSVAPSAMTVPVTVTKE